MRFGACLERGTILRFGACLDRETILAQLDGQWFIFVAILAGRLGNSGKLILRYFFHPQAKGLHVKSFDASLPLPSSDQVKLKDMLYHTARISSVAWSPDSSRLATGSLDTNLIVWDIAKPVSARQSIKVRPRINLRCGKYYAFSMLDVANRSLHSRA